MRLAWREAGKGRPVILLHGLFSDAQMNWIKFGHAEKIAVAGFRVIMPDLRGVTYALQPAEEYRLRSSVRFLYADIDDFQNKLTSSAETPSWPTCTTSASILNYHSAARV